MPSLLDLESAGVLPGAHRWHLAAIAGGVAAGLVAALVVPGQRVALLSVVAVSTVGLLVLAHPRFRRARELSVGGLGVLAITAASWFSGAGGSPLRHLLILPLVYTAGIQGPGHLAAVTLLVVAARLLLLAADGGSAVAGVELAVEILVAVLLAGAAYALRASLGHASRQLERTDELHRVLVQTSANAVYVLDTDGRVLEANEVAESLTGHRAEDIVGRNSLRFIPPELHEETVQRFQLAVGGAPQTFESALLHADGTRVPVLVTNVRVRLADGRTAVHGIASDLTPTLRERRAREASERRFQRVAESSKDGIYVLRTAGGTREFLYVNPAMTELTGVSAQDFYRDASVTERYVSADQVERIREEHPHGQPYAEPVLVRWAHPDGDRWLQVREVPYEDDAGEPVGIQGIVHDVTHLVRRQEESEAALEREQAAVEHLRRVDEMKNAFLQSVSHELRTPLTSVVGLADTVMAHLDALDKAQLQQLLTRTVANAHKLERLLSDLLDVDRMARGVLVPSLAEVDLATVAARVLEESDGLLEEVVADLQPATIAADAPKVERIIENLLHNAIRHTPAGTRVLLRVRPSGDGAEILVEDEGSGIEPDLAAVLFEPFTQGTDSAQNPSPGTGIGLTLVARFTELHGGTVTAGEREGGGARFRVWLPAEPGPPPGPTVGATADGTAAGDAVGQRKRARK